MNPCQACGQDTQDDGYGEPVHSDSGLYWHGDTKGLNGHVAVRR